MRAILVAVALSVAAAQQQLPIQDSSLGSGILNDNGAATRSDLTCGRHQLAEGSYTIRSPSHPSNYGNNYDCEYELTPGTGVASINIECSAFDLERHRRCRYDWLRVGDTKFCGTSGPTVTLTGPMRIDFHTDYSVVRTGFLCTISARPASLTPTDLSCGSHTLSPGLYGIKSPGYPSKYRNNLDCSYTMTPGSGVAYLTLACCEFDIESHSSCSWDWLRVNDVKYCGRQGPALTETGTLNIDFHSDYSVVKKGYQCEVEALAG